MVIASRLPLEGEPGREIVHAVLNGKPAQLQFDTGSQTSLLTRAAVDRLGLRRVNSGDFQSHANTFQVSGIGGARNAMGVTASTVDIGGLRARNYNFLAADVPLGGADGLLSSDLISQFDIDLDFVEHQIQLFQPVGDCSAPAAFLEAPLYSVKLLPIGENRTARILVEVNGKQVVAEIDTGASSTALYRRAAARLGLALDGGRAQATGIGPKAVPISVGKLNSLVIGDLEFDNMPVAVLDEHGDTDEVEMLLGADFQSKVHLWISYSSKTLIIQYPPKPTKRR